jgi:DNA primase
MDKFDKEDIVEWLDEGIAQDVLDKYDVRYNKRDNRIVYPIRDNDGNIISVKGRTLDPDFKDKKGFASRKYAYYTSIGTTYFFFGYYENREEIEKQNTIIIFEGEKSVMKLESFGMYNCVASLTDALTEEQVDALIKSSCRDVVIAWDKGVLTTHIKTQVKRLKKYKNVYYLKDTQQLLKEKDSPIDQGIEVFMHLYDNKERIL